MSTGTESIVVPEGFKLHTENTSHILLPSTTEAFLNPVQEFNRDLSVACIKTWSEELDKEKEKRWKASLERRAKKAAEGGDKKRLKRNHFLIILNVSPRLMRINCQLLALKI
jgi:tRNA (guanine26-N2/guanine27-N2)-dimethyltransferase